jgi:hypothetical protein
MEDDGHKAQAEARKTSAVDTTMIGEWVSRIFLTKKPSGWTDDVTEALS